MTDDANTDNEDATMVSSFYGIVQREEVEALEMFEEDEHREVITEMIGWKAGKRPSEIFAAWKVLTVALIDSGNRHLAKISLMGVVNLMCSYVNSIAMSADDSIDDLAGEIGISFKGFAGDE